MRSAALGIAAVLIAAASPPPSVNLTPPTQPVLPRGPFTVTPAPAAPPRFEPAPTPNLDLAAPTGPRQSGQQEITPGFYRPSQQYRGDGFSPGSTAQGDQEKNVRPGVGFKLRMPLQQ